MAAASKLLANILYNYKGMGLSVVRNLGFISPLLLPRCIYETKLLCASYMLKYTCHIKYVMLQEDVLKERLKLRMMATLVI